MSKAELMLIILAIDAVLIGLFLWRDKQEGIKR